MHNKGTRTPLSSHKSLVLSEILPFPGFKYGQRCRYNQQASTQAFPILKKELPGIRQNINMHKACRETIGDET